MTSVVLQDGETITASTTIARRPEDVYAMISDVTRIPEWSPECVRCTWLDDRRFKGWNRRRFGRWATVSTIVVAEPGREFSFVVRIGRRDFTRWTYRMEPGPKPGTTRLIEEFRMCMPLPYYALLFERWVIRVPDRRADLERNIEESLRRIREIAEA